jgi:hypothetical protein
MSKTKLYRCRELATMKDLDVNNIFSSDKGFDRVPTYKIKNNLKHDLR